MPEQGCRIRYGTSSRIGMLLSGLKCLNAEAGGIEFDADAKLCWYGNSLRRIALVRIGSLVSQRVNFTSPASVADS